MINLTTFKPQLVGEGNPEIFLYHRGSVFIEPKIDGIRCMVSKKGDEIKLYSRSGREITSKYTKIIGDLRAGIIAKNIILDGELAVLHGKEFTSSNYVIRKSLDKDERYVFFPFDVIYFGEEEMTDYPLLSRKQTMQLSLEENRSLVPMPYTFVDNMEDVNNFLRKCLERGMEGVVLKGAERYKPDDRYSWLKLKPFRTLDLEVINRKPRKDNKGWIYHLIGKGVEANASSNMDLRNGMIVEVKYERRYETKLRHPQILRVRNDL